MREASLVYGRTMYSLIMGGMSLSSQVTKTVGWNWACVGSFSALRRSRAPLSVFKRSVSCLIALSIFSDSAGDSRVFDCV